MKRVAHVLCAGVAAALLLSACATPSTQPPVNSAEQQARLEALSQFRFTGGLGIWTDEESISARIDWKQAVDELTVLLSAPLGFGNLTLVDSQGLAELKRGSTRLASGESVDRVLQNGLGLSAPVPVAQLQRWVRGLPGEADSINKDEQGRLASLRYKDAEGTRWQARFLRYSVHDRVTLPALITASGGPYSVRLVIKNWQIDEVAESIETTPSSTRLAIPAR